MPYIDSSSRKDFDDARRQLEMTIVKRGISNGELNYLITLLGNMYLDAHGKSYNTVSDVIRAMECAKLEFYRRVAAPYEDKKIEENGDVYT